MIARYLVFLGVLTSVYHGQAQLVFDKPLIQLESAPADTKAVGRFTFSNTGKYPVKITSLKTNCGCTAATSEKRIFEPGEKGEVTVSYRISDRRGNREMPVMVNTDDAAAPLTVLKMRVLVREVVEIQPTFLFWNPEEPLAAKKIAVKVFEASPVKQIVARCADPAVNVRVETVKAGTDYSVVVTPAAHTERLKALIEIVAEYPAEAAKTYNARVRVR